MSLMRAGYADGSRWFLNLGSKWSRMVAVHESTHDEIAKETPFGQVYSTMALLLDAGVLDRITKHHANRIWVDCGEAARDANELAATYLGWLCVVGDDHWSAKEYLPENYQAYLTDAYEIGNRFAKSRVIHYTIVQASVYLAFHHKSLWDIVKPMSLSELQIPVLSHPDTNWSIIRSGLLNMEPSQMRRLLAPTCERLELDIEATDVDFESLGPEQVKWSAANEELVKDLRIALAHELGIDAIIDPDERESFHIELCDQVERLFGVKLEREYVRESTHHHIFPDGMHSTCPLQVTSDHPVAEVLRFLESVFTQTRKPAIATLVLTATSLNLVTTVEDFGSELFRWTASMGELNAIAVEIEKQAHTPSIILSHRIHAIPPQGSLENILHWLRLAKQDASEPSASWQYSGYYILGSFENWVDVNLTGVKSARFLILQLRTANQDQSLVELVEMNLDGLDCPILKVLPPPAANYLRSYFQEQGVSYTITEPEEWDFHFLRHLLWSTPEL